MKPALLAAITLAPLACAEVAPAPAIPEAPPVEAAPPAAPRPEPAPSATAVAPPAPPPPKPVARPSHDPLAPSGSADVLDRGDQGGLGSGSRQPANARVAQGPGRLPPEAVQRVVRRSLPQIRGCYEDGLRGNLMLEGKVMMRFTIGLDGAVEAAADSDSTLPDKNVTACLVRTFLSLSFPAPTGGKVKVVYPLVFNPGDGAAPQPTPPADQGRH